MKSIVKILKRSLLFLFTGQFSFSQGQTARLQTTIIEPYPLQITSNKTTTVIFPYAIKSVDRGSVDVLVQKAKGVENVLLVKAGRENFPETNLSVITAEGKLYSFVIDYIQNPASININMVGDSSNASLSNSVKPAYMEVAMRSDAERVAKEARKSLRVRVSRYDMNFGLNGIFINNDVFFFKLELINHSNINYDVDMLRFLLEDEKKSKRTASQEIEIQPLYAIDKLTIKGGERNVFVFALPKFTILDKKYLSVQLMEKKWWKESSTAYIQQNNS